MKIYDAVIIGGGPAGLSAALYLRRAGKSVAVLEGLGVGGQLAVLSKVDNYLGSNADDGYTIAERMKQQAVDAGAVIVLDRVLKADLQNKTLYTGGEQYRGAAIIIASGAAQKKLGLAGEEELTGAGVSYCAVCDGAFFRGRDVMLVAAAGRGERDLNYLAGVCKRVYYVAPMSSPQHYENVTTLAGAFITKLHGKPLSAVTVSDGGGERTVDVDGLFVDVGLRPQSALFAGQIELASDGGIITDEKMKTSLEGVYAAGDVRKTPLRQVATAVADGAVAATAALKDIALSKKIQKNS